MDRLVTADPYPARQFQIFTGILKAYGSPEEGMFLSGVASSTVRDHHGDRILESGIRDMEEQANRGMTIFLNHEYRVPEDVAGSTTAAKATQRGTDSEGNPIWDLDLEISINDTNERAVQAWKAIRKKGTKLGLSIGANIPDGGWEKSEEGRYDFSHVTLLETSIVGIPANPRSWISMAMNSLPPDLEKAVEVEPVEPEELEAAPPADDRDLEPEITQACPTCGEEENESCSDGYHKKDIGSACEECGEPEETCACGKRRKADEPTEDLTPEAQSEPETLVEAPDAAVVSAAIESLQVVNGEVSATQLQMAVDIARALAKRLGEVTLERDEALEARKAAETERDEAIRKTGVVLEGTRDLIRQIGNTPLGRKSAFREQERSLTHLEAIYGAEYMKMLES